MVVSIMCVMKNKPVDLIRIGDLAQLTGLPVSYLRRLADAGLIPTYRVGRGHHRRFPRSEAVHKVREVVSLHS